MPYDDTDVKKMIRYQTERKVGFSRHKQISTEVKDLIHGILEAKTDRRFSIKDVRESTWMNQTTTTPTTTTAATTTTTTTTTGPQEQAANSDRTTVTETAERQLSSDAKASNNNNDNGGSKLPRPVITGVTVVHRGAGHRVAGSSTQATTPRSFQVRCHDDQRSSAVTSPGTLFIVRDKLRATGR